MITAFVQPFPLWQFANSIYPEPTSIWVDIVLGLLIAGALAAWVPESFWQMFFLANNPTLARIEGLLVGLVVSATSGQIFRRRVDLSRFW